MVPHILSQTCMLSQGKKLVQPSSIKSPQRKKQNWKPASDANGPANHSRIDEEINTGPPEHILPLTSWHELSGLLARDTQRVESHHLEHMDRIRDPEEVKQNSCEVRRPHHLDLRVQADHDCFRMMSRMTPTGESALLHVHQTRKLIERLIQPACLEGGSVGAFVPTRIARTVDRAINKKGRDHPAAAD